MFVTIVAPTPRMGSGVTLVATAGAGAEEAPLALEPLVATDGAGVAVVAAPFDTAAAGVAGAVGADVVVAPLLVDMMLR